MLNLGYLSKYRQELYGLSIISIIIFHYFETLIDSGIDGFPYYFSKGYVYIIGSIGVDIFLFLSGIGIYQSCKHNEKKLKKYYQHRFSKVIIPYTIIGLLFWVIKDVFVIEKAELLVEDFFLINAPFDIRAL